MEKIIYVANAQDEDLVLCGVKEQCHCGKIVYELEAAGNTQNLFSIEPHTGFVRLTGNVVVYSESQYQVAIGAKNADGFGFNQLLLTINIVATINNQWGAPFAEMNGKIPSFGSPTVDKYRENLKAEFDKTNGYSNSFQGTSEEEDSLYRHIRHRRVSCL